MNITNDLITSLAVNDASIKNGRSLFTSKKFISLGIDKDDTIIFGECKGSGKSNYYCSMDFVKEEAPIPRCNCPSRQIPCKHVLGLMIAYVEEKDNFQILEIPEDVVKKREKKEKSAENKAKKETEKKPPTEKSLKAKATSETKKINNQLQGVENSKEIFKTIVNNGLASIDANQIKEFKIQVKNLGNFHIGGIENSFNILLNCIATDDEDFKKSIDQLNYINALLTKSEKYLNSKLENPLVRDVTSKIEEQIGHIWNYNQLSEYDLVQSKANLIQLHFVEVDEKINKQLVETGIWFDISSKKLCKTINYRPYKARKYIKETDSIKSVVAMDELFFYPSENTPRVTIKDFTLREVTKEDIDSIKENIVDDYSMIIKDIKNIFKAPLSDKDLYYLIKVAKIKKIDDDLVLENQKGETLIIKGENKTLLEFVYSKDLKNRVMLIKVSKESIDTGFTIDVLSIVRDEDIFTLN